MSIRTACVGISAAILSLLATAAFCPAHAQEALPDRTSTQGSASYGPGVRLRITAQRPGTTLLLGIEPTTPTTPGTPVPMAFAPICTAPCEATLQAGAHVFAVEEPGRSRRATRRPVLVEGDGTLELGITSLRPVRAVLYPLALVSLAAAIPVIAIGMFDVSCDASAYCHRRHGMVVLGSGLVVLGVGFTVTAANLRDRGRVIFRAGF